MNIIYHHMFATVTIEGQFANQLIDSVGIFKADRNSVCGWALMCAGAEVVIAQAPLVWVWAQWTIIF